MEGEGEGGLLDYVYVPRDLIIITTALSLIIIIIISIPQSIISNAIF